MSDDFYLILKVSRSSTQEDIKQAYRKLAKENHPDKGGNKETFQKIQLAYETLSDVNKKRAYDMQSSTVPVIDPNFMNIFKFFNHQSPSMQKKADEIYVCQITLDEVFNGCSRRFHIKRKSKCDICSVFCFSCVC